MNLRSTLDSLRLVLKTQSPRELYGSNQARVRETSLEGYLVLQTV
jgi:hypothetical protein